MKMLVTYSKPDPFFVNFVDAWSRVLIWTINHADSSEISRIGNFSHTPGGFISGNGQNLITAQAGLTLRLNCGWGELIQNLAPYALPEVLTQLDGSIDWVYLARELGLFHKDVDGGSGKFIRCSVEDRYSLPFGLRALPIRAADNTLIRMDAIFLCNVFTVKFFKFTDLDGVYPLLFRAEKPAVSFLIYGPPAHGSELLLSTNGNTFSINMGTAWLCAVGNLDELDWEILRPYRVKLLWHDWQDDHLRSHDELAETLHIVAEAKRHRIDMTVVRAIIPHIYPFLCDAAFEELSTKALIAAAQKYDIPLPAELRENPCRIDLEMPSASPAMPHFWKNEGVIAFWGHGQQQLLVELLRGFCGLLKYQDPPFPVKKCALLVPHAKRRIAARMFSPFATNSLVCFNTDILCDVDALKNELKCSAIEYLLVMNAEELKDKDLNSLLDAIAEMRIPVARFCATKDLPEAIANAADQSYYVATDRSDFLVKCVKTAEIKRYLFGKGKKIKISKASEEEMTKVMDL